MPKEDPYHVCEHDADLSNWQPMATTKKERTKTLTTHSHPILGLHLSAMKYAIY